MCQIDVVQMPPPRKEISIKEYGAKKLIYIRNTRLSWPYGDYLDRYLRRVLISYINSRETGVLAKKWPDASPSFSNQDYYVVDLLAAPYFDSEYDWWVSFPAVYPCTLWWPIQKRTSSFDLHILAVVRDAKGKPLFTRETTHHARLSVDIYGFFRSSPDEEMIERIFAEAIELLAEKLSDPSVYPKLQDPVVHPQSPSSKDSEQ